MDLFGLKREPAKGRKRFEVEVIEAHERTRQGVLFVGANDKKGQGYLFDGDGRQSGGAERNGTGV